MPMPVTTPSRMKPPCRTEVLHVDETAVTCPLRAQSTNIDLKMDEDTMPTVSLSFTTIHFRILLIFAGDGQYWAPNDQQARASEMISYVICLTNGRITIWLTVRSTAITPFSSR